MPDYKRIYKFFGCELSTATEDAKNGTGECPACGNSKTFSVIVKTGQFRCLKCSVKGNVHSFFQLLLDNADTTAKQYAKIKANRKISVSVLKSGGIVYSNYVRRWLVPYYDESENPANLGTFMDFGKSAFKIFKAPELPMVTYRPFDKKLGDKVYAFEGEWDLLAYKAICKQANKKCVSLISTGGATTFTDRMIARVVGKNVTFFWDNDKAGQEDGRSFLSQKIKNFEAGLADWKSIKLSDYNNPKDVRDAYVTTDNDPSKITQLFEDLSLMAENRKEFESTKVKENTKFETNIDDYEEVSEYSEYSEQISELIYTNQSIRDSYDIVLASSLSINLPDLPLWTFVVAPPSTGKSLMIEAFGGTSQYFEYTSKLTAEAFVSGAKGQDVSLIEKLPNKTLFIGDLTVILGLPAVVQEKLWNILREAYNGSLKVNFGNQEAKEYKGYKFNMVAGVTPEIYAYDQSSFGIRMLIVDFVGEDFDEDAQMDIALAKQSNWDEIREKLKCSLLGYYKHLNNHTDFQNPIEIPEKVTNQIKSLAKLAARLRTKVQKDRFEGSYARPKHESPTRIAVQLQTLCKCLCWVHQTKEITPDVYRQLAKVAFDSCPGYGLEIIKYLARKGSASKRTISTTLSIPLTRTGQLLDDYTALGILKMEKRSNMSGNRGRNANIYWLDEKVNDTVNMIVLKERKRIPKQRLVIPRSKSKLRKRKSVTK